jgi:hypothetical protein
MSREEQDAKYAGKETAVLLNQSREGDGTGVYFSILAN